MTFANLCALCVFAVNVTVSISSKQEALQPMQHTEHVNLLQPGIPNPGGVWADFGSGGGAFTLALADLVGPSGEIYSVDKDRGSLREQERAMQSMFPQANVHYVAADFTRSLDLPPLDGVVMANSLHFLRHKEPLLEMVRGYLKPGGRFILVEYNADQGNMWVPHPLSYTTWEALARRCGFISTRLIARVPSRFLGEIYSSLSIAEGNTGIPRNSQREFPPATVKCGPIAFRPSSVVVRPTRSVCLREGRVPRSRLASRSASVRRLSRLLAGRKSSMYGRAATMPLVSGL